MKLLGRALFVLLLLTACHHHKRTPWTALPAPPAASVTVTPPAALETAELPPAPPLPQPNAPATPVVDPLADATNAFTTGNYAESAHDYDGYLQVQPSGERRAEALFGLAISLALLPNTNADWNRINALLKEVVDHYPGSPYWAPASVILSLATDARNRDQKIKQLTSELDKLKQIDADRRRRP